MLLDLDLHVPVDAMGVPAGHTLGRHRQRRKLICLAPGCSAWATAEPGVDVDDVEQAMPVLAAA